MGLELGFPALRETRVGFEMELVEERLREDGGSRPVLGVARAGLTISAAPTRAPTVWAPYGALLRAGCLLPEQERQQHEAPPGGHVQDLVQV